MTPSPFRELRIQPSYGRHEAVVVWRVDAQYAHGAFYVFRSLNGVAPWQLLTPQPVIAQDFFKDETFFVGNRTDTVHYRLLLKVDGLEFDSPVVGIFDQLSRLEYGACRAMIQREFIRMARARNGLQIFYFKPLTYGKLGAHVDQDTHQITGPDCPNIDPAQDTYGQKFIGGFGPAVQTWMEATDVGPIVRLDKDDGATIVDENTIRARLLAFPRPVRDDLIVQPLTDDRYAVTEVIKPWMFRGVYPIAYDVKIALLQRSDPRYRLPVPLFQKLQLPPLC